MGLLTPYLAKKRNNLYGLCVKGNILDIGCGPADGLKFLNEGKKYFGIEYSKKHVEKLKNKYKNIDVNFKNIDVNREKFSLGIDFKFNTVLMIAFVEHIRNQDNLYNEINKYINIGGKIIITTPTVFGNYIILNLFSKIGLTTKEAYIEHCTIYTKSYINMICREFGFKIIKHNYFQFFGNQFIILEKI